MSDVEQAFADKLRAWREDRQLSQSDLAELLGVDASKIEAWEQADDLPGDLQSLGLKFRALQTAAGERLHDVQLSTGSVSYGITRTEVRQVWSRFMAGTSPSPGTRRRR